MAIALFRLICLSAALVSAFATSPARKGLSTSGAIVVDSDGTELAYTDSGAPSNGSYITIFALNGLGFNANVFQQIQPVAIADGFRFVGINRRGYGGSTPLTELQANTIANGTQDAKNVLWQTLGIELLTFLDTFTQQKNIPPISNDRLTGGIVLIGWSFGNVLSLPAIANIDQVSDDVRSRLAARIRSLVLQEPSANALGLPVPSNNWVPEIDPLFPTNIQGPFFAQWVTSYFDHGDLSTRSNDVLEYILPSFNTTPSIYNNKKDFFNVLELDAPANIDFEIIAFMGPQLESAYVNAVFNQSVRGALPHMNVSFFTGTRSPAFSLFGLFVVEDNATTFGQPDAISFRTNNGTNHFIFWDEPEQAMSIYKQLAT